MRSMFSSRSPVFTEVIHARVLIAGVSRSVEEKVLNRELNVDAAWIPGVVTSEDDTRQGVDFNVGRWTHVHVRQASTVRKRDVMSIRCDQPSKATIAA